MRIMKKTYVIWTDIVRILAIIMVIFIHSNNVTNAYYLIDTKAWWPISFLEALCRPAVPLFVMISGYFLLNPDKNEALWDFFRKRFTRIGIPSICWIIVYYLWANMWQGRELSLEFNLYVTLGGIALGHLFFLAIINGLYLITPMLRIFAQYASRILYIYAIILAICGGIFLNIVHVWLPDIASGNSLLFHFTWYIGYFLFGGYIRKYNPLSKPKKKILLLLFVVYLVLAAITTGLHFYAMRTFFPLDLLMHFFLHYLAPNIVAMSLILFLLLTQVTTIVPFLTNTQLKPYIQEYANASFGIYLVHMIVLDVLNRYIFIDWKVTSILLWLPIMVKILAVLIISYGIVWVFKQIPLLKHTV